MEIEGKVTVVTGGARGIGAALVRALAAAGAAAVAVVDLDGPGADLVADEVGGTAWSLDVADAEATTRVLGDIETRYGRVDIACLNAGIATSGSVDVSDEVWERTWRVNVMSHVYATRCLLPGMLDRGEGYLIHTSSAAGLLTSLDAAPYAVTKHAVVALAEWLSITYGARGIVVSALCPQFVDTPMLDEFADSTEATRAWVRATAISADDVATSVIDGIRSERFLMLPHPDVDTYVKHRADDRDRWLAGMRRMYGSLSDRPVDLRDEEDLPRHGP